MRVSFFLLLGLFSLILFSACDSGDTVKILEFQDNSLLPKVPVGANYEFTFTITYGDERWDGTTGYVDSEIFWGIDEWKRNGVSQTSGPANISFSEGKISGTVSTSDIALWSFDITIQKGKEFVTKVFYLSVVENIVITTKSELPLATSDLNYITYFNAEFGTAPYYWYFDNWTKNGIQVNNPPIGLNTNPVGFISGKADNSEVGLWTFDAKVYDTSVPTQMYSTKSFELTIDLKISVPTNFPTIQSAVDYADSGDIVYLETGTLKGIGNRDVNLSGKSLTIVGNPSDPGSVIIDCEGTSIDPHRAFTLRSREKACIFDGFTITNGSAPDEGGYWKGGAIYLENEVELTIQNVIFDKIVTIQTTTDVYGGLLHANEACSIVMKNVIAKEISAEADDDMYGQLIYTNDDTTIDLIDCVFDGGKGASEEYRGLFYFEYTAYSLNNVVFKNLETISRNDSHHYGMFYLIYGLGTWNNVSVFNNNSICGKGYTSLAYNYGLGYFDHTDISYNNFVFANNEFDYEGSSSYWYYYSSYHYYGKSKWDKCVFANNVVNKSNRTCRLYGSILKIYYNEAKFYNSHFVHNVAPANYSYSGSSYGGGIEIDGSSSDVVFNNCVFAYNEAGLGSAGISKTYSSSDLLINNCTFYKNSGYYGGALFFYGDTTVNNCIFWDNTATMSGNQIYGYSTSYSCKLNNSCYRNQGNDIYGNISPSNCVTSDPYFKDTGDNPITGDCTFSADEMTVTGTIGTSSFTTEIMRGDLIYLTSDGIGKALFVLEVVSDSELKVAGYYKGTPGTGVATITKCNFNLQQTSKGDANDSPCVDSGDNTKILTFTDIDLNVRVADGNGDSTATVDMGAYELQ